jgi:predicted transcriptional regulator
MKSANLPTLRVDPELRRLAESLLEDDESLSGFVESAVRAEVDRRVFRQAFIERGLVARDRARKKDAYVSAASVLKCLEAKLARATKKTA